MATRGRQKVEMVKVEKESNLQVTFSKRRFGLFKKASELSTLCAAEVAIIVFSPGNKVFSFGHPDVESVLERYSSEAYDPPPPSGTMKLIQAHRSASIRELNMQLTQVMNRLEAERKRGEEQKKMREETMKQRWWEGPVDGMNKAQLGQLKAALLELKEKVTDRAEKLLLQSATTQHLMMQNSSATGMLMPAAMEQLTFDGNVNYENNLDGIFNSGNMMIPHGFNNTDGFGPGASGKFY